MPSGQPFAATARDLAARGVLDHPDWLRAYARFTGADARVKAGEYEIAPGTTPRELLRLFESGDVVQPRRHHRRGLDLPQPARALERSPYLDNTLAGQDDAAVMTALGEPGTEPEGLFFPDTYLFGKGTTDVEILRQARARMQRELEAAWGAARRRPADRDALRGA